jgi:signal transduction histidine kinase
MVELVHDTVCAFAMLPATTAIRLRSLRRPPCSPLIIDRDAIAQVIMNLLDNAVVFERQQRTSTGSSLLMRKMSVSRCATAASVFRHRAEENLRKFYRVGSGPPRRQGQRPGLAIVSHVVKRTAASWKS